MNPTVRELLEKALVAIRSGWNQHFYRDRDKEPTTHCMVGALLYLGAKCYTWEVTEACRLLADVIEEQYPGSKEKYKLPEVKTPADYIVVQFNDAPERTHEEVIMVFEKALAKE